MSRVKDYLCDDSITKDKVDEKIRAELDMLKTMSDAVDLRNKLQVRRLLRLRSYLNLNKEISY